MRCLASCSDHTCPTALLARTCWPSRPRPPSAMRPVQLPQRLKQADARRDAQVERAHMALVDGYPPHAPARLAGCHRLPAAPRPAGHTGRMAWAHAARMRRRMQVRAPRAGSASTAPESQNAARAARQRAGGASARASGGRPVVSAPNSSQSPGLYAPAAHAHVAHRPAFGRAALWRASSPQRNAAAAHRAPRSARRPSC